MDILCNNAKKNKSVEDQVQCRNKIDHLPYEIFLDIVSRLPITSLVQFRLVCRAWNNTVKNDPCLIFDSRNQLSFVDLSDLENNEKPLVATGFGFHPSTKEYKVVKIVYYLTTLGTNVVQWSATQSDVQILELSSNKWRSIGQIPYLLRTPSTGVLVNGRLHWVTHQTSDRVIVSFDLGDDGFQEIPMPDFSSSLCNYHISVLGGCLSAGLRSFPSSDVSLQIWVIQEYNVKESWECVCSITANSPTPDLQNRQSVSALYRRKNGEILLEHQDRTLVSYDPKSKETRNLMLKGMPELYTCRACW